MSGGPRTLIIGFDALDEKYLDRFAHVTPNLTNLRYEGVDAPLKSTNPPWTASAWPSMYTGTEPGHHGVYDFFKYDYPDEGEIVSRDDVEAPAIWNYLSQRDIPSVVLNMPVTHPAEDIEGAIIPGYLAGEEDEGSPSGIREEVSGQIGEEYRIYSKGEIADDPGEKLQGYLDLIDMRKRAAVELLTTREWEVGIIQVQKTDAVFHNFDDESAFKAVYEAADDLLGAVIEAVDEPVNLIICSDHGMGYKDGYQIQVNDVLRDRGYIQSNPEGEAVSLGTEKTRLLQNEGDSQDGGSSVLADGFATFEQLLSGVGITPGKVYRAAEKVGVEQLLLDVVPRSLQKSAGETVDWRNSQAYCRSASRLGVRINLEGREPDGVVPQVQYKRVRDDLIEELSNLRTPDGEPAFERVLPREAVYDGPNDEDAPDIVLEPKGANHVLSTSLYGQEFLQADLYDHEPTGVFIGHGPDFDHEAAPSKLSLTDIAPIAMALAGQPVPKQMTGTVPDGVITAPVHRTDYGDVPYGSDKVIDEAREEVTDSLADLGYI